MTGGVFFMLPFTVRLQDPAEWCSMVAARLQTRLEVCDVYGPDIDITIFPFHVMIKSVYNTVIEGFWRRFLDKTGHNLKTVLLHGKLTHVFMRNVPYHT
jgi:hypothetical protein